MPAIVVRCIILPESIAYRTTRCSAQVLSQITQIALAPVVAIGKEPGCTGHSSRRAESHALPPGSSTDHLVGRGSDDGWWRAAAGATSRPEDQVDAAYVRRSASMPSGVGYDLAYFGTPTTV